MRNFKGEMQDENKKARPRYAPFRRRNRGYDGYGRDHNLAQGTSHTTSETSKKYLFVLLYVIIRVEWGRGRAYNVYAHSLWHICETF